MSLISEMEISLLLIFAAGLIATLSAYFYVNSIEKQKKKEANKTPKKSSLNFNSKAIIEAQEVQSDGVLPTSSAIIGVISLEIFARKHSPDYIVGVNRGGWLLSTYLAHRLDIRRNNLFRYDAEKDDIIDYMNLSESPHSNSKLNILLVDDISKSGDSISKSIGFVKNKFPSSNISVAVLVICGRKTDENINYSPYWTLYNDIQLPWSSDERKRAAREIINSQGKVFQLGDENSLDIKLPVIRIADGETKEGEGVDISNNDIEAVIRLYDNLVSIPEAS